LSDMMKKIQTNAKIVTAKKANGEEIHG
jgi:hypothetical protein